MTRYHEVNHSSTTSPYPVKFDYKDTYIVRLQLVFFFRNEQVLKGGNKYSRGGAETGAVGL